jgi:3',5'-cyclic AMP phosphodiesterase CpdA
VFVLAHLSDPHLGPLPLPRPAELASKRLLGYANWRRHRHAVHRAEALDAIVGDLRRAAPRPDHIAVTGDLVNIALPFEFERARRWLESLGSPQQVSLVPGNHDAYVAAAARHRERHWTPYMAADEQPAGAAGVGGAGGAGGEQRAVAPSAAPFPYLRRRGAAALVGLSTAVATPLFMATGRLGEAQIACAAAMLARLGEARLFRVVMIHHPPVSVASSHHKRLIDAAALREAIAAAGAELVIHGHDHVRSLAWLPGRGAGARVAVIGVPSASAVAGARHEAAAYNLYRIGGGASPGTWSCEVISRGLRADGTVAEIDRINLSWPQRE